MNVCVCVCVCVFVRDHIFRTTRPIFTNFYRQSKEASILWSRNDETRELPGERDNARNNARCTQARKTTHGLDGQHQDVDRTPRGRVNHNDGEQR